MHLWINGALVDPAHATVSALDHGLTVGDGVFEAIKVAAGVPFALRRHLERLRRSAAGLRLPEPDLDLIRHGIDEVLAAAAGGDHRLRITYTGGPSPLGSERGDGEPTLVIALAPLGSWPATTAIATVPWTRNERGATAGLKTTSYADNVIALAHARALGASEAIFANTQGLLCEGTGSNILLEVDGRLVTPTLATGCLAGVTRALALEWCDVEELDVPLAALLTTREVVLASTTRDLQAVDRVDGTPLAAPGPLTRAAQAAFAAGVARGSEP